MNQIVGILALLIQIYSWILLARVLMSWIPNLERNNPIVQLLLSLTEPVLEPIRKLVPSPGGIDISILVAYFALILLQQMIRSLA